MAFNMGQKVNNWAESVEENPGDSFKLLLDTNLQDACGFCAAQNLFKSDLLNRSKEFPKTAERFSMGRNSGFLACLGWISANGDFNTGSGHQLAPLDIILLT